MARLIGTVSSGRRRAPDAPTIGTATDVGTSRAYNNGAATVTFTAPSYNGGLPVTSYTVTSSPGGFTASGASSPLTVTGLASNTAYTFTITATNGIGTSAASSASNSITATTVPQAPTIGTATISTTTASVPFTAGATGGKAVSTYTATSSPGSITGTNSASPISVSGLTGGTSYTFTVTATNANGTSAASASSNSVTAVTPVVGTTWTLGTYPTSVTSNFKVKGVGPYVVLYNTGTTNYYITTNGSTWTSKTFPTSSLHNIEYYNGIYLACDNNNWTSSSKTYYTSTDLTNWTSRTHNDSGLGYSFRNLWTDGNSILMSALHPSLVTWALYRTTDGINWTNYDLPVCNTSGTGGTSNRVAQYGGSPGYFGGRWFYLTQISGTPTGTMSTNSLGGAFTYTSIGAPYYNYGGYLVSSDFSIALSQGNGGSNGQYRTWSSPQSYSYVNPGTGGWGAVNGLSFGSASLNPTNAFIVNWSVTLGSNTYYRSTTGLTNSWTAYSNAYFNASGYYANGNYNNGTQQANNYLFDGYYATSTTSGLMVSAPMNSGTKSLYSVI